MYIETKLKDDRSLSRSSYSNLVSLTGNEIPSLYLSFRCHDTFVLPLCSRHLSSLAVPFLLLSPSLDSYSLVLADLRMRMLPVIAHSSSRFRTELVLIRRLTIKNVVLAEARGSISGRWSVSKIFPLQKERYFTESRSLVFLSSPALEHQIVYVLGGSGGSRQIVKAASGILLATVLGIGVVAINGMIQLPQTLHHILVGQVLVRDASAEIQDLPQCDCKSPHVALGRVFSLEKNRRNLH